MNIEKIDKWLDNEYGVSYTRLEELHDFVIEQDLKHREEKDKEIERLKNIISELEKWIEEHKQYQLISERYIGWEDKLVNKLKALKENK